MSPSPQTPVDPLVRDNPRALLNPVGVALDVPPRIGRVALDRLRQDRGDARGLQRRQFGGASVEIMLRGRLDAVDAGAHLRDVEIDFHDPRLAPDQFGEAGEPRLEPLADVGAAGPEEYVLRGLLRDGRSAAQLAAIGVARVRRLHRGEIEAVVGAEIGILRPDRGAGHGGGDCVERHPVLRDMPAVDPVAQHQAGGGRVDEAVKRDPGDADPDEHQRRAQRPAQDARDQAAARGRA